MSKTIDYLLIQEYDIDKFQSKVVYFLNDFNYELVGGPFISKDGAYTQAMAKKEET